MICRAKKNIEYILDFFNDWEGICHGESTNDIIELYFESKWYFPEEYGCMYHALWYCDKDGWHLS